jgi:hypothetical protein
MVPLSRHSSLNELRDLVGLLKPRDIHPCVEDPEKLTYLDLEGCFGDLCDLSNCAYLARTRGLSFENSEIALQKVMAERWVYDDISDDGFDEDSNMNSVERESEVSNALIASLTLSDSSSDDERPNKRIVTRNMLSHQYDAKGAASSQESITILYQDNKVSNADMINHYMDIVNKGGNITLKSVDGEVEEAFL